MLFRQTRNTHSLQSKILQNKSSKLGEMEKQATFLTLQSEHHRQSIHLRHFQKAIGKWHSASSQRPTSGIQLL